jgi:predicted Fe-Mo cluster-binding NifX family protein
MIVCVPLTSQGWIDPRWGRADRVAVAKLHADEFESWQEFDVGWGHIHDSGSESAHHARIARFLREQRVQVVVADHMGPPMQDMLRKMGIEVYLDASGSARQAALEVAARGEREDPGHRS